MCPSGEVHRQGLGDGAPVIAAGAQIWSWWQDPRCGADQSTYENRSLRADRGQTLAVTTGSSGATTRTSRRSGHGHTTGLSVGQRSGCCGNGGRRLPGHEGARLTGRRTPRSAHPALELIDRAPRSPTHLTTRPDFVIRRILPHTNQYRSIHTFQDRQEVHKLNGASQQLKREGIWPKHTFRTSWGRQAASPTPSARRGKFAQSESNLLIRGGGREQARSSSPDPTTPAQEERRVRGGQLRRSDGAAGARSCSVFVEGAFHRPPSRADGRPVREWPTAAVFPGRDL